MTNLAPFADDAASLSIGQLTVENGTNRIALYGSLDITRDKPGLAHARALLAVLQATVTAMEADADLPAGAPAGSAAQRKIVANPFE